MRLRLDSFEIASKEILPESKVERVACPDRGMRQPGSIRTFCGQTRRPDSKFSFNA